MTGPRRAGPEAQIEAALAVARRELGDQLVAACLYGSATQGGLRRWSDIDLLIVVPDRPAGPVLSAMVAGWLPLSGPPGAAMRPLEATVLALTDVRPWRWPPWRVLQFGEWQRADLSRGRIEPPRPDADVALLIAQARATGRPLIGPAPSELLDPVPPGDLRRAMAESLPHLLEGWAGDTRNVLLTLARMWLTAATGCIESKDRAAEWALARLPADAGSWLVRARDDYLGLAEADWTTPDPVAPLVDLLVSETKAALAGQPPQPDENRVPK